MVKGFGSGLQAACKRLPKWKRLQQPWKPLGSGSQSYWKRLESGLDLYVLSGSGLRAAWTWFISVEADWQGLGLRFSQWKRLESGLDLDFLSGSGLKAAWTWIFSLEAAWKRLGLSWFEWGQLKAAWKRLRLWLFHWKHQKKSICFWYTIDVTKFELSS